MSKLKQKQCKNFSCRKKNLQVEDEIWSDFSTNRIQITAHFVSSCSSKWLVEKVTKLKSSSLQIQSTFF